MDDPYSTDTFALNQDLPTTVEQGVHDPFHQQAHRQVEVKTVNPWDNVPEHEGQEIQPLGAKVNLEEVEQLMCDHELVKDAVLVSRDGPEAEVVGFVTLHDGAVEQQIENLKQSGDEQETQQVQLWESVFDKGIYTSIDNKLQREANGRDFSGWVSAYDGNPLDKVDMDEWLDETIATILSSSSGHSLDILELGTGSGLILFSLAKWIRSYLGLEISRTAVDFVTTRARSIPDLADKVHVFQGSATDFHLLG